LLAVSANGIQEEGANVSSVSDIIKDLERFRNGCSLGNIDNAIKAYLKVNGEQDERNKNGTEKRVCVQKKGGGRENG